MRGMNGVEFLEGIKVFSPTTECIMLSALDEISLVVECIQKGAIDYLVIPFSSEELVLKIERALEQKHLRDS
jgi:DNA-binding NtrC family response regulator